MLQESALPRRFCAHEYFLSLTGGGVCCRRDSVKKGAALGVLRTTASLSRHLVGRRHLKAVSGPSSHSLLPARRRRRWIVLSSSRCLSTSIDQRTLCTPLCRGTVGISARSTVRAFAKFQTHQFGSHIPDCDDARFGAIHAQAPAADSSTCSSPSSSVHPSILRYNKQKGAAHRRAQRVSGSHSSSPTRSWRPSSQLPPRSPDPEFAPRTRTSLRENKPLQKVKIQDYQVAWGTLMV